MTTSSSSSSWWSSWLTEAPSEELARRQVISPSIWNSGTEHPFWVTPTVSVSNVVKASGRQNALPDRPFQCLVTDMDECLIHSWDISHEAYMRTFNNAKSFPFRHQLFGVEMLPRDKSSLVYGIFRPGLIDFLNYAFNRFDYVILWSAGTHYYVNQITQYMFSKTDKMPNNVFARPFCENHPHDDDYFTKPLKKLQQINPSIKLSNIFFLDDNPNTSFHNKTNHILIPRWDPSPTIKACTDALSKDRALYDFIEWLERPDVKAAEDVRRLTKHKIFKEHAPEPLPKPDETSNY
jgi:hypothetical protein